MKIVDLRPRHCFLAGSSGTHNVCVCVCHEDVNLMLEAIEIKHLTEESGKKLSDYHDCLKEIT